MREKAYFKFWSTLGKYLSTFIYFLWTFFFGILSVNEYAAFTVMFMSLIVSCISFPFHLSYSANMLLFEVCLGIYFFVNFFFCFIPRILKHKDNL